MSLLNKKAVRIFVLERWKKLRPGREMSRVAPEMYDEVEAIIRNKIDGIIKTHPSVGKTIRP